MRYRLVEITMILVSAMAVTLAILQPFGMTLLGIPMRPRPITTDFFKELGRIAEYQGLHEGARYNGGTFVYDFNTAHQGQARNLQQLVDFAPLIVVGTIRPREPRERPHAWIETIYPVLISETVKGDARSVVKVLAFGHQSVVDISTGRTQASLRSDNPIRTQLLDRDAAGFLNEIRALAHRGR